MHRRSRWIAASAVAVTALGLGTGIAVASGGDDDATDQPITGAALDQASAVALAEAGGGTVVQTELQDEEGYYEVEVKLSDGRHVDVHLDRDFRVIDKSTDHHDGGNDNGRE